MPGSESLSCRHSPSLLVLGAALAHAAWNVLAHGLVERAFAQADAATGVRGQTPWPEALHYVRRTMGQSKIDVFTHLASGDRVLAERATAAFEQAFADAVAAGAAEEIPGAGATLGALRDAGYAVVLTTGFSPATRDAIIDALGWRDLVDDALAPADAGRGRPAPDLVWTAALRTGAHAASRIAVVGDTASDVESGLRAGAGLVVGVLSGAHDRAALEAAGAHVVIDDVTALPGVLAAFSGQAASAALPAVQ